MHYPETPSTRQWIAWSAFTDGSLPILLNHKGACHCPGRINPLRPKSHLSGSDIAFRLLNYNSRMLWAINLG